MCRVSGLSRKRMLSCLAGVDESLLREKGPATKMKLEFGGKMIFSKYKLGLAAIALSADVVLSASAALAQDAGVTPIRITVGETVFEGVLNSTMMAQSLAERLPMTVTFGEHPGGGGFATKVTHLEPALSTDGTELGAAPGPGDIALYVPSGNLGFYYGQLEHWPGAVVLGTYEGDPGFFERQTGEFTVTIEAAEG